jgi:hypothetical protein
MRPGVILGQTRAAAPSPLRLLGVLTLTLTLHGGCVSAAKRAGVFAVESRFNQHYPGGGGRADRTRQTTFVVGTLTSADLVWRWKNAVSVKA